MDYLEGTVFNTFVNGMMLNIDVLGALLVVGILQESNCTMVININGSGDTIQLQSEFNQHPSQQESLASAV